MCVCEREREREKEGSDWGGWNEEMMCIYTFLLVGVVSCGVSCSHLLDNGAYPVPVNNEGDTPLDLADDDVIRDLITEAIHRQGMCVVQFLTLWLHVCQFVCLKCA